jgi:hypothetical protein
MKLVASLFDIEGPDIVILLYLAFSVWMFVNCWMSARPVIAKIGWSVAILFAPLLGAIIYCIFAKGRTTKP